MKTNLEELSSNLKMNRVKVNIYYKKYILYTSNNLINISFKSSYIFVNETELHKFEKYNFILQ